MRGELEKAIEREWRRTQRRLEPIIRAEVAKSGLIDPDFAVAVNVSQNVLKDCLSVTMNHAMPQGLPYFVEIATRLACYALTAVDPDMQEVAAVFVKDGLMEKLAHMQSEGIGIKGEWV